MAPPLLLAVGRARGGPEAALFEHYNARLRPPLLLRELVEARGSPAEIRRREGAAILAALPEGALAVALDLGGEMPDSERLAMLTGRWIEAARPITFIIGGAEGLDEAVLARADHRISLGKLTWPHMLVRGLLAEALFRAQCIRTNHPYHRAWRPG
ncbi:23S rRNA (pseudouridine(1915)-N(3))-methyltransferase RlmH [Roseomonas xinghualingensis]|uniref:23S rRNA (pseudouridine(1915)-N(3))-methyltransferase RlmH n=1 Tax=Roseomonas xinghualingensis TaxID=2986475 RepID=UPI0021F0ADCC|nr:23S rRNA (pseudouridine(1915)-N(3))-methyltransferase RlmH [Roseomonas sp. SXEYE001]MCV4208878.1 23S rRNA (pseudouridine(1915)-N(3))-methyltransferase RlmH [Roseomonas sp. SXEYE001]